MVRRKGFVFVFRRLAIMSYCPVRGCVGSISRLAGAGYRFDPNAAFSGLELHRASEAGNQHSHRVFPPECSRRRATAAPTSAAGSLTHGPNRHWSVAAADLPPSTRTKYCRSVDGPRPAPTSAAPDAEEPQRSCHVCRPAKPPGHVTDCCGHCDRKAAR